jgi:phosphoribosylformylglycinamidine synthase
MRDLMTAPSKPTLDTVEHAASTPDEVQPFAALGLKPEEYQRIRDIL